MNMSLNKYMHPRNRYRNTKPSFLHLALKYPDFRAMTTQDETGKVLLDFKNADALRALTRCLLIDDFDLSVELPQDRLVPTLPLRLNYIHWLEDIVGTEAGKWCIDIGTGASCIYPLLASKMNQWNFVATEKDTENYYHAQKNVENNKLSHLVHVVNVSPSDESILTASLATFTATESFDLCMCNPPFFADHMEAQGVTSSRSFDRPEAGSVSTASPQECITAGGEVAFIRQLVEESTLLRDKIRVYSSMVGKKSSLVQLKEELRHQKVAKFSTTEFCQGKTMRWGIAWTYDPSVNFPKSQFENRKTKPPLQYVIPEGSGRVGYNVHELAKYLQQVLESIKVHCYQGKKAKAYTSITLTASENTWCHQRRLRRQKQKQKGAENITCAEATTDNQQGQKLEEQRKEQVVPEMNNKNITTDPKVAEQIALLTDHKVCCVENESKHSAPSITSETSEGNVTSNCISKRKNVDYSQDLDGNSTKRSKVDEICDENTKITENSLKTDLTGSENESDINQVDVHSSSSVYISRGEGLNSDRAVSESNETDIPKGSDHGDTSTAELCSGSLESKAPKEYILKCVMRLKRAGEVINMELDWLDGTSRELMYQVLTYLKNKLAQRGTD